MEETKPNEGAPPANYKPKSKRMARKWKRQMKPDVANGQPNNHSQKQTSPATEREKAAIIAKQLNGSGAGADMPSQHMRRSGGKLYRSKEYRPSAGTAPGVIIANGSGRPWWPLGGGRGPNDKYIAPNGVVIANGSGRPFDVRTGLLGRSKTQ